VVANLVRFFQQGGIVMWPLLVFALLTATVIVERAMVLRKAKINIGDFLAKIRKALLVDRDVRGAMAICEHSRGPVASVVKAGLSRYGRPAEEIERSIEGAAAFESARLERGLLALSASANIAPLIGFLGTVTGMIKALSALGQAGLSSPGAIAAGIAEALVAAAAGLLVAIPAQLGHTFLLGAVNTFLGDIEAAANTLMETVAEIDDERRRSGGASGA